MESRQNSISPSLACSPAALIRSIENTLLEQDSRFHTPVIHKSAVQPSKVRISGEKLMNDVLNLKLSEEEIYDNDFTLKNVTNSLIDKMLILAGAMKEFTQKLTAETKKRMELEDRVEKLQ